MSKTFPQRVHNDHKGRKKIEEWVEHQQGRPLICQLNFVHVCLKASAKFTTSWKDLSQIFFHDSLECFVPVPDRPTSLKRSIWLDSTHASLSDFYLDVADHPGTIERWQAENPEETFTKVPRGKFGEAFFQRLADNLVSLVNGTPSTEDPTFEITVSFRSTPSGFGARDAGVDTLYSKMRTVFTRKATKKRKEAAAAEGKRQRLD